MTQQKTLFPLHAPILVPISGTEDKYPVSRIFCVGRNYEAHAKEMGVAVDREAPFYFTKAADTYVPSGSTVQYPPGTSNYHYEMELVLAIGRDAFQVEEAEALEYVYGYACGLDMTRRDLQLAAREQRRPWDLGKDFEQSAVMSEIVPVSQCGHLSTGAIELRVNGQTKQSSDLSLLIHAVPALIAHLSGYYHLKAGDLIYTGTPEGVGPVVSGDHIQGSISGLGDIELKVA
ncbi:fumarylacetoacetate hydrolase family protein [Polaromonas sp.]|uniref:fumarylacetoacetate hydrolase family protein n=1 Tax=Polaromonas sp. TaxID=1869339 RepID=UPI003BA99C39